MRNTKFNRIKDPIINLYLKGYSTTKIAHMYNTSDETIYHLLKRNDITLRNRHQAKIDSHYKEHNAYS